MILEALVTTVDAQGRVNIAPMGPVVDPAISQITLRPFVSSQTHANLRLNGRAVVHVTDDCLLLARAAIGTVEAEGLTEAIDEGRFHPLRDACRWYAVQVRQWSDHPQRPDAVCSIVNSQRRRDFFGLNRAKHAVVEAAILATRIHLLDPHTICQEMDRLAPLVEKTGSEAERTAFQLLEAYIAGAEVSRPDAPPVE